MSNPECDDNGHYEYAYDEEGNEVLVRRATAEETKLHSPPGPIRPVTSADLPMIRQRLAQQDAADQERRRNEQQERQRQLTVMKADQLREEVEKATSFAPKISPICSTKRAIEWNDQPESEG